MKESEYVSLWTVGFHRYTLIGINQGVSFVGQKRIKEKSPEELKAERVTAVLEETDRTGKAPAFVRESPGQFLRDMYEVWHRQGGKEGGRWRNSIRKMRDEWLTGRNAVPSLHPKLMGRVKLTRSDVRALLDLFLGRWRIAEGDDPISAMTTDGYVAFAVGGQRLLRDVLLVALLPSGSVHRRTLMLPACLPKPRAQADDMKIQTFIEEYRECDALVTFSRNRIVVDSTPSEAMKNFFYLFNAFYEEDSKRNRSKCTFIWIVDFGRRIFEDDQSFRGYFNAGFLSLLLQSFCSFDSEHDQPIERQGKLLRQLRIFDSKKRHDRWNWLVQRSVVIAENLRWEEFEDLYSDEENDILKIRLRDSGVTAQHILPSEIPPIWNSSIKSLIGKSTNFDNISFTTLFNKNGWSGKSKSRYLKYFSHARTIKSSETGISDTIIQSVEMPYPGDHYDEAFRIIYFSALYRLSGKRDIDSEEMTAFAYLRKLGFNILKVDDFIRIFQPISPDNVVSVQSGRGSDRNLV